MTLDVLPSSFLLTAEDEKNLKKLLDDFGSMDLKDISTAYCKAGRDVFAAANLLSKGKGIFIESSMSESEDGLRSESDVSFGSSDNNLEKDVIVNVKEKKCSVSMGTVAGVIGKEYVKPRRQLNGLCKNYKPVKLYSSEIPETEIWDEKQEIGSVSRNEPMKPDMEGFLYDILGNAFQMDMELIHDVVGQCGYDMQMSFDQLLNMSAATLGKSDDVMSIASGSNTKKSNGLEFTSFRRSDIDIQTQTQDGLSMSTGEKKKMGKEILVSLFSKADIYEERQERARPNRKHRPLPCGVPVAKPIPDVVTKDFTFINREPVNKSSETNKDTYEDIREAVLEYWTMMKNYYKVAVDAFANKEYEQAKKLQKEGDLYMMKAREADEKSCQKLCQNSEEEEEIITVNVHYLDPKDALSHVKLQLASYSGFDSIRFLKIVVGTDGGDTNDGKRKRLIIKLLEKEEITWTEEDDGWTISIGVDKIDPKKLSFAKKYIPSSF